MVSEIYEKTVNQLIYAGRILDMAGMGDFTRGHVSVRDPDTVDQFLMKPHRRGLEEITPDTVVTCDREGERLSGGPRHSEVYIHSEIYKARPDVACVIHTHPVQSVAFSATGAELLPISQSAVPFKDGLPYYTQSLDLIRSAQAGAGVAEALGDKRAVLMRAHGVAVVGGSIAEAVMLALTLEEACRIQLLAQAAGPVTAFFPEDDVNRLAEKLNKRVQFDLNFDYLCRRVDRLFPVAGQGETAKIQG